MAIYNDYPYSNMHGINQNWIIEKVKDSEKKIQDAIRMIDLAMIKLQEAIDAIESMRDDVALSLEQSAQALEKANQALDSLDAIRAELNIVSANANQALVNAQTAITKANEASQKADSAIEQAIEAMDLAQEVEAIAQSADEKASQALGKANQVSDDLRNVVEVQLPIISRVATNAMETAEQAIAQGEAFIAIYGSTVFSDIQSAINGRRRIYILENDSLYAVTRNTYPLPNNAGNALLWISTVGGSEVITSTVFEIRKNDNSWSKIERKINIGSTSDLTTQDKTSIVAAINEINQKSTPIPELELGTSVQIATYKEGMNRYKVFQKIVDLGTLPNSGSKTVAHGIDKTKVLRYLSIQGTASQENFGNTLPLPCVTLGSESVNNNIYVSVGGNNITIATGRDRSAYNGTLAITYIDNTPLS